jgi:hypothetical protein
MIGFGGMTVETMIHCHGEATSHIEATFARHGPIGTAARLSADPSEEFGLTVAITVSGICRAVSSINFKGGRTPDARFSGLPRPPKRVA